MLQITRSEEVTINDVEQRDLDVSESFVVGGIQDFSETQHSYPLAVDLVSDFDVHFGTRTCCECLTC